MFFSTREKQLLFDLLKIKTASQHSKFDVANSLVPYLRQELNLTNYHLSDSDKALLNKGSVLKSKESRLYANVLAIQLSCQQHNMSQILRAIDNIEHDVNLDSYLVTVKDNKQYVIDGLEEAIVTASQKIANGSWKKGYEELNLASMFFSCPLPKLTNEIQEHNPKVLKNLDHFKKHSLRSFVNKKFGSQNK